MRLQSFSRAFFAAVLVALAANLAFVVAIRHASQGVRASREVRDRTLDLVTLIERQNDRLALLVQGFTATAQTRYLTEYYVILAEREGEPATDERPATPGLIERMKAMDFAPDEVQAAGEVLAAAAPMQEIEKVAFAATQGLYDRASGSFVSDAAPDPAFATALVHSADYERHREQLSGAAARLARLARQRQFHERVPQRYGKRQECPRARHPNAVNVAEGLDPLG